MFIKRLITAALLLLAATSLPAADYYVAPHGNDRATGTQAQPWKTLAKANSTLGPGDTVYLRGGEYREVIKPLRSGVDDQVIAYRAYPGEQPVITGSPGGTAIVLNKRAYIEVDGITVTGKAPYPKSNLAAWVEMVGTSHSTVQNSQFQYSKGWAAIVLDQGASYNRFINNRFADVGIWDKGGGHDYGNTMNLNCASRNLIEGNEFVRGGHNLLLINGTYNIVRGNVFDNKWGENKGNRGAAVSGKGSCSGGHNVFEGNLVRNTLPASDEPVKSAQIKVEGVGHIVRRNFILNGHNLAINTSARDEILVSQDNHIYHNVIYKHGGPLWDLRLLKPAKTNDGNIFKNNIGYLTRQKPPFSKYNTDFLFDTALKDNRVVGNAIFSAEGGEAKVRLHGKAGSLRSYEQRFPANFAQNLYARPEFIAAYPTAPEDFQLKASSPLIDMGADLTVATSSGTGTVIPVGDAGYFMDGYDLVEPDMVQVGSNGPVRVMDVDYDRNTITIEWEIEWQAGNVVNLPYSGAAPDIGAYEYEGAAPPAQLTAPTSLEME